MITFREAVCREFGIQLTQTAFTSDFSNKIADKAGYKTDVALKYEQSTQYEHELNTLIN